jgi:hypothetical protein
MYVGVFWDVPVCVGRGLAVGVLPKYLKGFMISEVIPDQAQARGHNSRNVQTYQTLLG